ncbi:MAG TPA: hypothetical protein VFB29_00495 [Pseudolabrys sp.]|nr:hypothetical protein [Pseudolabrys sp.]
MTKVTITLPADDAEPFLRRAAEDAAKFGAWCDYLGPKTRLAPSWGGLDYREAKAEWRERFLKAKRIVEAFGIEYEPTSEAETMTVDFDVIGGKVRLTPHIPGVGRVGIRSGATLDYKHPRPAYRRAVHEEACRQAAIRVVRRWRAMIEEAIAA